MCKIANKFENIAFGVCKLIKQVIESYKFSIIVQENVLFSGKIYTVGKKITQWTFCCSYIYVGASPIYAYKARGSTMIPELTEQ